MNIWVPRCKIIEPRRAMIAPARVGGRFRLSAVRPDGRVRPLTGWFSNLVLDQGLDLTAANGSWINACRVGNGTTAPNVSDTNLVSHVAGTTTTVEDTSGIQSSAPYYAWRTRTFRFAQGAAAGNLTEVGIGTSASNGANLFSRELIRDNNGNPTSITVLSDEFLDVAYECRLYPGNLTDLEDQIDIGGVTYDTVLRAANVTNSQAWAVPYINSTIFAVAYNGSIGAITGAPSGSSDAQTSGANATYTNGSFLRDFTATWGLTDGNLSPGISAVGFIIGTQTQFQHQISFSPAIPKDNTKVLTLTFRRSWTRASI